MILVIRIMQNCMFDNSYKLITALVEVRNYTSTLFFERDEILERLCAKSLH